MLHSFPLMLAASDPCSTDKVVPTEAANAVTVNISSKSKDYVYEPNIPECGGCKKMVAL